MTEMIERVARAIAGVRLTPFKGKHPWDNLNAIERERFTLEARAAVAAMREPTEGMLAASSRGDANRARISTAP